MAKVQTVEPAAAPGTVKEKFTRERVVPDTGTLEDSAPAGKTGQPDAFEYMGDEVDAENRPKPQGAPTNWDSQHVVYIYREEPRSAPVVGEPSYDEVLATPITEQYLRDKWGGRVYRIIVKKGRARISDRRYTIPLQPKFPNDGQPANAAGTAAGNGDLNSQLLSLMRETLARLEDRASTAAPLKDSAAADAMSIQRMGFESALQTQQTLFNSLMEKLTKPGNGDPMLEMFKPLMVGLMTKMLEPRNTLQEIQQYAEALKTISGGAPGTASKSVLETLKEAGEVARALGYAPAGKGGGDTVNLLAGLAPSILDTVRSVVHDWSVGMQAAANARLAAAGQPPAPATAAPGQQPRVVTLPAPAPAAPAAANSVSEADQMKAAVTKLIHAKLIQIVQPLQPGDESRPVAEGETVTVLEDAADRAITYLNETDPSIVQQCVTYGAPVATQFLQGQPGLAAIATHPMLVPFINKVVQLATADQREQSANTQA